MAKNDFVSQDQFLSTFGTKKEREKSAEKGRENVSGFFEGARKFVGIPTWEEAKRGEDAKGFVERAVEKTFIENPKRVLRDTRAATREAKQAKVNLNYLKAQRRFFDPATPDGQKHEEKIKEYESDLNRAKQRKGQAIVGGSIEGAFTTVFPFVTMGFNMLPDKAAEALSRPAQWVTNPVYSMVHKLPEGNLKNALVTLRPAVDTAINLILYHQAGKLVDSRVGKYVDTKGNDAVQKLDAYMTGWNKMNPEGQARFRSIVLKNIGGMKKIQYPSLPQSVGAIRRLVRTIKEIDADPIIRNSIRGKLVPPKTINPVHTFSNTRGPGPVVPFTKNPSTVLGGGLIPAFPGTASARFLRKIGKEPKTPAGEKAKPKKPVKSEEEVISSTQTEEVSGNRGKRIVIRPAKTPEIKTKEDIIQNIESLEMKRADAFREIPEESIPKIKKAIQEAGKISIKKSKDKSGERYKLVSKGNVLGEFQFPAPVSENVAPSRRDVLREIAKTRSEGELEFTAQREEGTLFLVNKGKGRETKIRFPGIFQSGSFAEKIPEGATVVISPEFAKGQGIGYEILNKKSVPVTDQVQKYDIPEEMFEEFIQKPINEKRAIVIDSDKVKKRLPEYTEEKENSLQPKAREMTDKLLSTALAEDTSGVFRITAGGPGSGKSEMAVDQLSEIPGVIWDGTFANQKRAFEKIEEALKAGKEVEVFPIFTAIEDAVGFNYNRAYKSQTDPSMTKRAPVPDAELIRRHIGFRKNIPEFLKEYPNLSIYAIDGKILKDSVMLNGDTNGDFSPLETLGVESFETRNKMIDFFQRRTYTQSDAEQRVENAKENYKEKFPDRYRLVRSLSRAQEDIGADAEVGVASDNAGVLGRAKGEIIQRAAEIDPEVDDFIESALDKKQKPINLQLQEIANDFYNGDIQAVKREISQEYDGDSARFVEEVKAYKENRPVPEDVVETPTPETAPHKANATPSKDIQQTAPKKHTEETKETKTDIQKSQDALEEMRKKDKQEIAEIPKEVKEKIELTGRAQPAFEKIEELPTLNTRKIKQTKEYQDFSKFSEKEYQDRDIRPALLFRHATLTAERVAEYLDGKINGPLYKRMIKPVYDQAVKSAKEGKKISETVKSSGIISGSRSDRNASLYAQKKSDSATAQERQLAEYSRNLYDELLDRMNKERKLLDVEPIPKRKDYITHLNEMNVLTELLGSVERISTKNLISKKKNEILDSDASISESRAFERAKREVEGTQGIGRYIDARQPAFKFAKKRLGEYEERPSIIRSLNAYVPGALRYIYQAQNVAKNKAFKDLLPANSKEFFRIWNTEQVGGRKAPSFVSPQAQIYLNKVKSTLGANTILGNLATQMMQLASFPQVIAFAGLINTMRGIGKRLVSYVGGDFDLFEQSRTKTLRDLNIDMALGDSFVDSILESIGEYSGAIDLAARSRKAIDVGRKLFMGLMEKFDEFTVGSSYYAFYYQAIQLGATPGEAMERADIMTGKTQANYFKEALPPFLDTVEGKVLGQFGIFGMNQWEMFKRDFGRDFKLNAKSPKSTRTFFKHFLKFLISAYIVDSIGEKMFGRQPYDIKDLVDETIEAVTGESSAKAVFNKAKETVLTYVPYLSSAKFGSMPQVLDFGKDVVHATLSSGRRQQMAMDEIENKWALSVLLPFGGNQIRKTLQGVEAVSDLDIPFTKDVSKDKFEVTGRFQKIKALLFGAYSTEGGRGYFEELEEKYRTENEITVEVSRGNIQEAVETQNKAINKGIYSEGSNPVRDGIRKKYDVPSVISRKLSDISDAEKKEFYNALSKMNDEEFRFFFNDYSRASRAKMRKVLKGTDLYEKSLNTQKKSLDKTFEEKQEKIPLGEIFE